MESAIEIKERLYGKINRVEDAALLKEIEDRYFPDEIELTEEQQKFLDNDARPYMSKEEVVHMLNEREEKYLSGEMKTSSAEEVEARIKAKYGL